MGWYFHGIVQHSPWMVRLVCWLVSTLEKVTSAALQTTCVLLLMVELDGTMRRDETVSPVGGSMTYVIPICACSVP